MSMVHHEIGLAPWDGCEGQDNKLGRDGTRVRLEGVQNALDLPTPPLDVYFPPTTIPFLPRHVILYFLSAGAQSMVAEGGEGVTSEQAVAAWELPLEVEAGRGAHAWEDKSHVHDRGP